MRLFVSTSLAALMLTGGALPALAQDTNSSTEHASSLDGQHQKAIASAVEAAWVTAPAKEAETTTTHTIRVDGRTISYKATAGTLTLRDENAKPIASVFYTAYTLGDARPDTNRPVTFFYNGGPGSSSVWLHMGSFAPMRVQTKNPVTIPPAPYNFAPNPDTLLDKSDLVFIDAIGTGYSRALGDTKPKEFWGVDEDADAFAKAITRYVTKFNRWNSPKFLFGESYGTTRSAAVAYQLQDRGVSLNGVILLSSILNYGIEQPGYDREYIGYIPSYAATAWYHKKVDNRPSDLSAFVDQARAFAGGAYAAALVKGQDISADEMDKVAKQMSHFTGLSVDFIKRSKLRVGLGAFRKELLRDEAKTIGRFDSRYMGVDTEPAGARPEYDPSDTAISGAFVAAFHNYVTNNLNYKTDMPYRLSAYGMKGFDWDWKHEAPGSRWPQNNPDVALDLSAAMRTNPQLKVLSLNGYYDMATPFYETEYDLSHMMLEPAQKKNLEFRYYPSGHMIYLNPDSLHKLHTDLSAFYDETLSDAARSAAASASGDSAGE